MLDWIPQDVRNTDMLYTENLQGSLLPHPKGWIQVLAVDVVIIRWVNSGQKWMHLVNNNTPTDYGFQTMLDLRGSVCTEKNSPHHYTTTSTSLNCCHKSWI